MKEAAPLLAPFIARIFNQSFAIGHFPSRWKHAVVKPLLKKAGADESLPANFRPVSNLMFLSKVLERIANHQLTEYLTESHLLPRFQSAYRSGHSTETALLKVFSDVVNAIDSGQLALLGDTEVRPADTIRNLGVQFDSCMTMTAHVSQLVRGCFYHLRRIKTIRKFILTSAAIVLVNSFIVSRVDYCNGLLAGLPTCQLDQIQSVLNSAAHLICGHTPSDHITDLLRDNLHWLRVPQRIVYKLCLVTYKALNDHRMPDYISDFCIRVADKRLRSSSRNLLHVPRSSTKFGDCSFSIAGPTAWNSLPDHVKNASSHLKVS